MTRSVAAAFVTFALAGCMNLSGYDGNASFGCKAPDGVICSSMSGVYENARQNNLPAQRLKREPLNPPSDEATSSAELSTLRRYHPGSPGSHARTPSTGDPLRTPPAIQRIWIAPWKDIDNDLHDVAYLYVIVDPGDWSIDHHRNALRERFGPVLRAPAGAGAPTAAPRGPDSTSVLSIPTIAKP